MGEGDDKPSTAYVPPGYIHILKAVAAEDLDTWRDRLADGERTAYALDPATGERFEIRPEFWLSRNAIQALTQGTYKNFVVVVADVVSARVPERSPEFSFPRGGDDVAAPSAVSPPEQSKPVAPEPPPKQSEPEEGAGAKADEPASPPARRRKGGGTPQYEWDVIQAYCYQRFNDYGHPDNVSKFCRDVVIPWCVQRLGEGETPDTETLRPHVTKWIAAWRKSLLPE
jgi:hypothetical protein